jgi:hypothetical protein
MKLKIVLLIAFSILLIVNLYLYFSGQTKNYFGIIANLLFVIVYLIQLFKARKITKNQQL